VTGVKEGEKTEVEGVEEGKGVGSLRTDRRAFRFDPFALLDPFDLSRRDPFDLFPQRLTSPRGRRRGPGLRRVCKSVMLKLSEKTARSGGIRRREWLVHSCSCRTITLEDEFMASSRADEVAEILWELKRAGKIATYTLIARRAGFSAGNGGRAMDSCLKVVRRDWPHLQWWRAVKDDGTLENGSEQESKLREAGYALEPSRGGKHITLVAIEQHLMIWEEAAGAVPAEATEAE
jgi:alkylated DNA nucleotide flippase Atl1